MFMHWKIQHSKDGNSPKTGLTQFLLKFKQKFL